MEAAGLPSAGATRRRLRTAAFAVGAAIVLWASCEGYWRTIQPRHLQQRLFGSAIAGPLALRTTVRDCCGFDGGGMYSWTYAISPDQEAALARRCLNPDGTRKQLRDAQTPFSDDLDGTCVVARRYDPGRGEDLHAEVSEGRLKIVQFLF